MSRHALKIALAASLILNVFVLGAAAGAWFWQPTSATSRPQEQGLAAAGQALPADKRQAFRDALANARRDAQSDSKAARDARDKLAEMLRQTELDRSSIDAALDMTRTADLKVRARIEAAVIDFAESLDPKNRAILVDGLAARGQIVPRQTKK